MRCIALTLYPDMFPGALGHALAGAALTKGLWSLDTINIRDYATDKHQRVDDTPYGGGAGMVMKADVVARAIDAAFEQLPHARLIHLTPRGTPLTQPLVQSTVSEHQDFIFLCGRFEGIDERVIEQYQPLEISIGDFVLFGGELAAMVMMEAMLRYIPDVLGNPDTHAEESFTIGQDCAGLLEYPHYTKPPIWNGKHVPDVLTSGHHGAIAAWRQAEAEAITRKRRPDLWEEYTQADTAKRGDGEKK